MILCWAFVTYAFKMVGNCTRERCYSQDFDEFARSPASLVCFSGRSSLPLT